MILPANTRKVNASNGMKKASYVRIAVLIFYQNEYGRFFSDFKKYR